MREEKQKELYDNFIEQVEHCQGEQEPAIERLIPDSEIDALIDWIEAYKNQEVEKALREQKSILTAGDKIRRKRWYQKHKSEVSEYFKDYYIKNKEKIKARRNLNSYKETK